jgi:hypothetical protein
MDDAVKLPILLNLAQAHLKLLDANEAIEFCERALCMDVSLHSDILLKLSMHNPANECKSSVQTCQCVRNEISMGRSGGRPAACSSGGVRCAVPDSSYRLATGSQLDPLNSSVRKEWVSLQEQKRAHMHTLKNKYSGMFQKLSGFASEGIPQ